ncbi:hypothetical protein [Hymenobacter terricola]|uniref:hypothetical protein n=1 Tax=Hymenobacter terricola TaxID=2819236 RepID=UPI001B3052AB|nr:hypothetical protein [Hymenobacter terricola]
MAALEAAPLEAFAAVVFLEAAFTFVSAIARLRKEIFRVGRAKLRKTAGNTEPYDA